MGKTAQIILEQGPYFAGSFLTPDCDVDIHLHNAFEIFMPTTGNIRYYIEGQTYDLAPGDLVITNMTEIHRPTLLDGGPYGRKFLLFNPGTFAPFAEGGYPLFSCFTQRRKGQGNHLKPSPEDSREVAALLDKLHSLPPGTGDPRKDLAGMVFALELFLKVDSIYHSCYPEGGSGVESASTLDSRVSGILEDLNSRYQEDLTLDGLARKHFMEKYHMCHLFKKETGFSIMEYLQSRRILHAKSLIDRDNLVLSEIAQQCGFKDYSNFYKTFRKLMQLSPRQYREHAMKNPQIFQV